MNLRPVLILPAAALRTTALALRVFASTGQRLADILSPSDAPPTLSDAPPRQAPRRDAAAPQPAPVDRVRPDPAGLAARPAPEVVAALDSLGTMELADLYDHESKHRRRRAVLNAIEDATSPPASATGADQELLDDVREPDALVYSTQTHRR